MALAAVSIVNSTWLPRGDSIHGQIEEATEQPTFCSCATISSQAGSLVMESSNNSPKAAAWIKGKEKMIMLSEDCAYVGKIPPYFLKLFASTDSLYLSSLDFCDNSLNSPFFA